MGTLSNLLQWRDENANNSPKIEIRTSVLNIYPHPPFIF